jgi:glycosyltransferase involved in cell wall biosynthesis
MNIQKPSLEPEVSGGFQVVVLTHTDVRKDNRILKQIGTILKLDGAQVVAVGIEARESIIPQMGCGSSGLIVRNADSKYLGPLVRRLRRWSRAESTPTVFNSIFFLLGALSVPYMSFYQLLLALKEINLAKVKLIFCNDDRSLLVATMLAVITKSKLIYDAHELNHDRNGQSAMERKIVLLWESFFWSRIHLFITVSESIRRHYLETHGHKTSAIVLNSPIVSGESQESHSIGDIRSVMGLDREDVILLYVGALAEGRGIRLLLESAAQLPSKYHLVFLGEGELLPEIAECSKSVKAVHFLSPVPHDRIVDFISTADIGLCLLEPVSMSDKLALPNKFFDYAFAGLPILYSDFPEMSRVAQDFALGEKCENSVDSVLSAVSRLKGRRTGRGSLNALSWETQEEVILSAVASLLATD